MSSKLALEKVESLERVAFEWIATGKPDIGLIAEDVSQVVPAVVAFEKDGGPALGVDYAKLTAPLVEALEEQQTQIRSMQAQLDSFRSQLTTSSAAVPAGL